MEGTAQVAFYTTHGEIKGPKNAYTVNWDANQADCTCYGKTWMPGKIFESGKSSCCGDDAGEYQVTQGIGDSACCDNPNDCVDRHNICRNEYGKEVTCSPSDGVDNDCDGKTDCSDPDCVGTLSCGPYCVPEICNNGKDDDCDNYVDCADSDCIEDSLCQTCNNGNPPVQEICTDGKDNDCDGKIDCTDNDCIGTSSCPNCVDEICDNGKDDDCDGLIDNLDKDCPGCPAGQTVCKDGKCCEDCNKCAKGPQGCINKNSICEEGEGCACEDCYEQKDSCKISFLCDSFYGICSCPAGTKTCSDGSCRESCSVCNNGILEPGEECDKDQFGSGGNKCPTGCTGSLVCTAACKLDTSGCVSCPGCTVKNGDGACCVIDGDKICDSDCTADADPDCAAKPCTIIAGDCCEDKPGNGCDPDCIPYKDPDCSTTCTSDKDDCCKSASDVKCDPDCNKGVDPDCGPDCSNLEGNCCSDKDDNVCDPDCITGVDPDCKCGNLAIDNGETCDRTNLGGKIGCSDFGFNSGVLACFAPGTAQQCKFDTSGCYNEVCINKNTKCDQGEDCRCSDCAEKQATCGYGQVCDNTGSCKCEDGTTLCADGTCRQVCSELPTCNGNGVCEFGEGCGCSNSPGCVAGECNDCKEKTDTCKGSSMCIDGKCTSCSLTKTYWTEDCVGKGKGVSMIVEGTEGCKGKSINLKLKEQDSGIEIALGSDDDVETITAVFDNNGKINYKWITKWFEKGQSPNDCFLGSATQKDITIAHLKDS